MDRRRFLKGAAASTGLAALGIMTTGDAAIIGSNPFSPSIPSIYGVSIHSNFRNSIYANDDLVLDAVVSSKAAFIRDLLFIGGPWFDQDTLWRRYAAAGIGIHANVGAYGNAAANAKTETEAKLVKSEGLLTAVAGFNEPDGKTSITNWLTPTAEWQKWLYTTTKTINPDIAVCLGALRGANKNLASEQARLMDACAGHFDYTNLHIYPGARSDDGLRAFIDKHLAVVQGHPVVVSEYGGTTAWMSDDDQARIVADGVIYLNGKGIKPYVYELMDDPDATGTDAESNFGIYKSDWTAKPAVVALRSLV